MSELRSFSNYGQKQAGIPSPQQYLQLMGLKIAYSVRPTPRPITKPTLRQPFMTQPKSLAVIHQNLDRFTGAVAKDEQRSAERIVSQRFPA